MELHLSHLDPSKCQNSALRNGRRMIRMEVPVKKQSKRRKTDAVSDVTSPANSEDTLVGSVEAITEDVLPPQ